MMDSNRTPEEKLLLGHLRLPGIMVPRNLQVRRSPTHQELEACRVALTASIQDVFLSSSSEPVHLPKRLAQLRNSFGRFSLAGASITDIQKRMRKAIRAVSRTKSSRPTVEPFTNSTEVRHHIWPPATLSPPGEMPVITHLSAGSHHLSAEFHLLASFQV